MVATAIIAFMLTNYLEYLKLPTKLSSATSNFQAHLLPSRHHAYLVFQEGVFQASGIITQKNCVRSALGSTLSVCIDNDCVQQGAMQSLGKLRDVAEPQGVEVGVSSQHESLCPSFYWSYDTSTWHGRVDDVYDAPKSWNGPSVFL